MHVLLGLRVVHVDCLWDVLLTTQLSFLRNRLSRCDCDFVRCQLLLGAAIGHFTRVLILEGILIRHQEYLVLHRWHEVVEFVWVDQLEGQHVSIKPAHILKVNE